MLLTLVAGPHPTGSPGPWQWPRCLRRSSTTRPLPGALLPSCLEQQCSVTPSMIVPLLASASSQENGFQISITVGFQQHPNGLPQAQQPQPSRTTGAKTKVGPGNAFLRPEQVKRPRRLLGARECVRAQEVEKEAAGF